MNDLDAFHERFNLRTLPSRLSSQLIYTIHGILKLFLLRRLEAGAFGKSLPPKKELVIYCPLSVEQRGLYDAIVKGSLRHLLLSRGGGENVKREEDTVCVNAPLELRANRKSEVARYDVGGSDDDEYFENLDKGGVEQASEPQIAKEGLVELGPQHRLREMFARGHKVLASSQFTTMLDITEAIYRRFGKPI